MRTVHLENRRFSTDIPSFLLLAAKMAPVRAPLVMEFQGSSFPLILTMLQSIMEKRPPQTAKLPVPNQTKDTLERAEKAVVLHNTCCGVTVLRQEINSIASRAKYRIKSIQENFQLEVSSSPF